MTNNPTIDGVSRELLRKKFEEENEHRGWFVAGGRSDDTGPEGFVYEDFTTDMCWTCYFQAAAALQSTIAQLEDKLSKAINLDSQQALQDRHEAWMAGGKHGVTVLRTPEKDNSDCDYGSYSEGRKHGWNACLDATAALNGERK